MASNPLFEVDTKGVCIICLSRTKKTDKAKLESSTKEFKTLICDLGIEEFKLPGGPEGDDDVRCGIENVKFTLALCDNCDSATFELNVYEYCQRFDDNDDAPVELDVRVRRLHEFMEKGNADKDRVRKFKGRMNTGKMDDEIGFIIADILRKEIMEKLSLKILDCVSRLSLTDRTHGDSSGIQEGRKHDESPEPEDVEEDDGWENEEERNDESDDSNESLKVDGENTLAVADVQEVTSDAPVVVGAIVAEEEDTSVSAGTHSPVQDARSRYFPPSAMDVSFLEEYMLVKTLPTGLVYDARSNSIKPVESGIGFYYNRGQSTSGRLFANPSAPPKAAERDVDKLFAVLVERKLIKPVTDRKRFADGFEFQDEELGVYVSRLPRCEIFRIITFDGKRRFYAHQDSGWMKEILPES